MTTAVGLADSEGVASVSMRRLAAELGFEVMSLYNHVTNKDDLLDAMVESVAASIAATSAPDLPWRAQVRTLAVATHEALVRHPWASELWVRRWPGPARWRLAEAMLAALAGAELSPPDADMAFHAITLHVQGFAGQEQEYSLVGHERDLARRALEDAEGLTHVRRHLDHHLSAGEGGSAFEFVLEAILDAIDGRRTTPPSDDGIASDGMDP